MEEYLENKEYNLMIDEILRSAPLIKTLYVRSSNEGSSTGTLKNGVKVVKLQPENKRS